MTKAFLFPLLLVFLSFVPLPARENFIVDDYHVSVVVREDSSATFNEYLSLNFIRPSHGLIRDIQYRFRTSPFTTVRASVSNIAANVESSLSYSGDYISLRLGSESEYVSGPVNYRIRYDYLLEDYETEGFDEFYVNLLSAAWDTSVKSFSFSVTFPHPFDPDKVHITYGEYGSSDELSFLLSDDGLTVYGSILDLEPFDAVTIRAEFEEGYFIRERRKDYGILFTSLYIILASAVMIYALYSFYTLGRDDELIIPVRFTPPDGMSSLDVGYITDGHVTFEKDILSMFFYFADKGYMKIEDKGSDCFCFVKLKDIEEERPEYEKDLFSLIFSSSSSVDTKSLARRNFSAASRTKTASAIERHYENNNPLYEEKSLKRASSVRALGMLSVMVFALFLSIASIGEATLFLLFPSLIAFAFLTRIGSAFFAEHGGKRTAKVFNSLLILIILLVLSFMAFSVLFLMKGKLFSAIALSLLNAMAVFFTSFFSYAVNKRSAFSDKALTEILGYKEFLETVEMDQLRALIEEDPEFYYHNLSYAIALGLEEKYSKKFSSLSVEMPSWYSSPESFSSIMLWSMFHRNWMRGYTNAHSAMRPPQSGFRGGGPRSGPGSSGFSGRGFSGGGGRSW